MTAGRDYGTAGALGRLRTSHADREQAIDVLKAAFVQCRLTKDEFDSRVGQVFASRTYADLDVPTADIPDRVTSAQPPAEHAHEPARHGTCDRLADAHRSEHQAGRAVGVVDPFDVEEEGEREHAEREARGQLGSDDSSDARRLQKARIGAHKGPSLSVGTRVGRGP